MAGVAQQTAGRVGRPSAPATKALNRHLLEVATRLFVERGYAATSIGQLAAAAGASKQTIYRRYASKRQLFAEVVSELGRGPGEITMAPMYPDPVTALRDACRAALELVSNPQSMNVYRTLITEGQRFPDLVACVRQTAVEPINDIIRSRIEAACKTGTLRRDCSVEDLLHALTGMTTGWLIQERLLGRETLSTVESRDAFFDNAWDLFLQGAVPRA